MLQTLKPKARRPQSQHSAVATPSKLITSIASLASTKFVAPIWKYINSSAKRSLPPIDNDPTVIQTSSATNTSMTAPDIETLLPNDNILTEQLPTESFPPNLRSIDSSSNTQTITHTQINLGDGERTKKRYEDAAKRLNQSLCTCRGDWQPFEIPKFNDIPNNALLQVQEAIENMLSARENSMKNLDFWSKRKRTIKRVFLAVSPFANHFLQIAKEGSAVLFSFNICNSLL